MLLCELCDVIVIFFVNEFYNEIVGFIKLWGENNGIVIKDGYIIVEWGDIECVDMIFSVMKSFLFIVVGIVLDDGKIYDFDE